jgi:phosphatidylserine/phosphatidylglycerophosphate/cardiolipin synthase-like enzyme
MHIKAIVTDEARVLIGSANFTDAGQHRNYEAGAYVEDREFARRLVTQLQSLIDTGLVRRYGRP